MRSTISGSIRVRPQRGQRGRETEQLLGPEPRLPDHTAPVLRHSGPRSHMLAQDGCDLRHLLAVCLRRPIGREESMWLLVLFSAVVNASPGGGASHAMTTVPFATEAECTAAKSRLAVGSATPSAITGHSNIVLI